jgi:hypothetical protein
MLQSPITSKKSNQGFLWLPFGLLILALLLRAFRTTELGAGWLPNFSPWMALAFAGTILFPKPLPWWSCLAALLGIDLILQGGVVVANPATMVGVYGCLFLAALWGRSWRGRSAVLPIFGGVLVCGLGFYVVGNAISWFGNPAYPQSVAGLIQAQTVGLPGWPPTWTFLRNSWMSDLLFTESSGGSSPGGVHLCVRVPDFHGSGA